MNRNLFIILAILSIIFIFFFLFSKEEEIYLYPQKAKDSDGTDSQEIINNMKNGFETIILKHYPFGYVEVEEWGKIKHLKKVYAIVEWKADEDLGAGNIYVGYSFDGKEYKEVGPFNASSHVRKEVIEIPIKPFSNIDNLRVRFRGEDLDFGLDAVAEVSIKLKVIRYKFGMII